MAASKAGILNQSHIGRSVFQMKPLREKIAQMFCVQLAGAALLDFLHQVIHSHVSPQPSISAGYYSTDIPVFMFQRFRMQTEVFTPTNTY